MRKETFRIVLALFLTGWCFGLGVNEIFGQCGADGTQPCRSKPTPKQPATRAREPKKIVTPLPPPPVRPHQKPQAPSKPRPSAPALASLSIYSAPGSTIMLNGKIYGTAASDGSFTASSLKPARYAVKISLSGYRDASRTVNLKAGAGESLEMALVPFPGNLTITIGVDGATIEIEGIGTYSNKVNSLPVSTGNYRINVSKAGYQRVIQNEYIAPGQTKNIQISLERVNIPKILAEAEQLYASNDYQEAISLCDSVLAVEPTNARANLFLGLSLYQLKKFDLSFDYLARAVSSGESLRLAMGRRRAVLMNEHLEFGYIELSQSTIAFYNTKASYSSQTAGNGKLDFMVPYGKITSLQAENYYNAHNSSWRLSMKVLAPKKNNKEDKKNFDFYSSSALTENVTEPGSKHSTRSIKCLDCEAEIQFIYRLISNFRGGHGVDNPGMPVLKRRQPETDNTVIINRSNNPPPLKKKGKTAPVSNPK